MTRTSVSRKTILVLASTFPRRKADSLPEFVLDFCRSLQPFARVIVLAPHDTGARFHEDFDGIEVYRFLYCIPRYEVLAYRGGMVNAFKQSLLAKCLLPLYLFSLFLEALVLVFVKRVHVVHAHWLFPQGLVAAVIAFLTRKPVIVTTHGGDVAALRSKLYARLIRPVFGLARKVTFVSNTSKRLAQSYLGNIVESKSAIIPMGIYLPSDNVSDQRRAHSVLFVGRLVAIKGVAVLLEALSLVARQLEDVSLDILGDGPLLDELKTHAERLGIKERVRFQGHVRGPDKAVYFRRAVVVVPSIIDEQGYEEGLPVVALEALAYKRPLVATRTGSLPELIDHENNGLLVSPGDAADLANALLSVLANSALQQRLSIGAGQTARVYSWPVIAERFMRIVHEETS